MQYIIITLVVFILELLYFKVADKYNIIDKPNHRSAHTEITLRGGGIIYPLVFIIFIGSSLILGNSLTAEPYHYLLFGIGLLTICTISFLDDIMDLSSKVRLVFHFISVTILLYFLHAFTELPLWGIPVAYIVIIGILNAYNFMDGINGMSGLYSLTTLGSLLYVNQNVISFTQENFIIYPLIASLVFLFFNFRKKAKCFMGDVGSLGIAFWIIALLGMLMIKTGDLKWLLLLTVYGIEVVLTIMERLKLKENIFEAHRRHLYQLFANDKKVPHLWVSFGYSFLQMLVNILLIKLNMPAYFMIPIVVVPIALFYLFLKYRIKKQIEEK